MGWRLLVARTLGGILGDLECRGGASGDGAIEEDAGALDPQPGPRVEPAHKLEVPRLLAECALAIGRADLRGMFLVGFTDPVAVETRDIGDRQLPGKMSNHAGRNAGRVGQRGTEKPGSTNLDGHAEAGVITTALGNQGTIGVVEVEIACELDGAGFCGETRKPSERHVRIVQA
jgi:hypothetical protein